MRLGVVGKIAVFLVLPVVLVLGGLLYLAGAGLSEAQLEQARTQLQETVTAYAHQANARASEIESLGRTTAGFIALDNPAGFVALSERALFDLQRDLLDQNKMISSSVIAFEPEAYPRAGRKLFAPFAERFGEDFREVDLADLYDYTAGDRIWYELAKTNETGTWTPVYYGQGARKWFVTFTAPILENGTFSGAVAIDIDLNDVEQVLGLERSLHDRLQVFTRSGHIVHHPDPTLTGRAIADLVEESREVELASLFNSIAASESEGGVFQVHDSATQASDGDVIMYAVIEKLDWYLVIKRPRAEVLVQAHRTRNRNAAIFAAVVLLLSITSMAIARAIIKPLNRLDRAVRALGSGNLYATVDYESNDELGQVVASFNNMGRQLREQQLFIAQQQTAIEQASYYDSMTNLPNRSLFEYELSQTLKSARRHGTSGALIFVDVDNFKEINNVIGHTAADDVLREVGRRLSECVRETDIVGRSTGVDVDFNVEEPPSDAVARPGGDEFTLLLSQIETDDDAADVAQRILDSLGTAVRIGEHERYVTVSMGIAVFPRDGDDADTLSRCADTAMFDAKKSGKGRFSFYSREMGVAAIERAKLKQDLRTALDEDQFELHYQPLINCASRQPVAVEALLRWTHPERGPVAPDEFIELAEESGIINRLGAQVMAKACAQQVAWVREGLTPMVMAVNVSSQQVSDPHFAEIVIRTISQSAIDPGCLELELTERSITSDEPHVLGNLRELKDAGVTIAIDDFGTHYSSLAYLKQFPIGILKVDRSFVENLPADEDSAAIASAILALAQSLRLRTIAEGVETEAQADFLAERGTDVFQGWLFAKAMPADECKQWLAQRQGPAQRQGSQPVSRAQTQA